RAGGHPRPGRRAGDTVPRPATAADGDARRHATRATGRRAHTPNGLRAHRPDGSGSERHGDPDLHPEADGLTSTTARAIAYSAVALLAIAALRATPPAIPLTTPAAAIAATPTPPRPVWVAYHDTLGRGESLVTLLERRGIDG